MLTDKEARDKELRTLLNQGLCAKYAAWAERFPGQFYEEIFRLRRWHWSGMKSNRPHPVGRCTNDIVFERLEPSLLKDLLRKQPKKKQVSKELRTIEGIGHLGLANHLYAIMALMRISSNWRTFYSRLQRAFPARTTTQGE